jgi:hypothetical protein
VEVSLELIGLEGCAGPHTLSLTGAAALGGPLASHWSHQGASAPQG